MVDGGGGGGNLMGVLVMNDVHAYRVHTVQYSNVINDERIRMNLQQLEKRKIRTE